MNKEIENVARKICFRSGAWNTCEECLEYNHATQCHYRDYAEAFINAGYRKKECKRQAVKEFAEKLKKRSYCDNNFMDGKWHRYVFVDEIDELLKEYEE